MLPEDERETELVQLARHEAAQQDLVTIDIKEYEALVNSQLKLYAIRNAWDEYQLKRKMLGADVVAGNLHRLRRRTLNKIGEVLRGNYA